jgi:hypothetical protein
VKNAARRPNRLRHQRQVACSHWWGMLQLANARLRAHFFTASDGALSLSIVQVLYWLTAIVTVAVVVTPPSEICRDTASPVAVPVGTATLI